MKRLLFVLLIVSAPLQAQVVAKSSRGILVAHERKLELFDNSRLIWSSEGVEAPSRIVAGADRVALIDSLNNRARIADLKSGKSEVHETGETPLDGVFIKGDLYLVERDAGALERITADGARDTLRLASDPAFLRESGGMLYVYSRLDGIVQEISPARFTVARRLQVSPFASDFEISSGTGYLVYPRDAKLRLVDLKAMKMAGEMKAGVVPIDLAINRESSAISATALAIADPSAKRVWTIEGRQSIAAAVARGFIRGLLGLGLFASRTSDFPTGVDRVINSRIAYDTTTGTLYRFSRGRSRVLAKGIAPSGFAATDGGIMVWKEGKLHRLE